MPMKTVAAPVLYFQHSVYIPFAWTPGRGADPESRPQTLERIEAEGERLCAAFGLKLDHAVSFSEDAIRIYGNDLANIQAAGAAMADFLSAQDGLRFVEVAEDGV